MIPQGTDAISPAPHHDIYSIEDLRQLIYSLKEASGYKPVGVKIAAVHNVGAIASGIVRAGADYVYLDGFKGGTGAAPAIIRDHVGIPLEIAIAVVDQRLRDEGIRNQASIVAAGSIRSSADMAKAIALGADVVAIGSAALMALGLPPVPGLPHRLLLVGPDHAEARADPPRRPRVGCRAARQPGARLEPRAAGDPGRAGRQRGRVAARQPRAAARRSASTSRPARSWASSPRGCRGGEDAMITTATKGPIEGYVQVEPAVDARGRHRSRIDAQGVYYKQLNEAIRAGVRRRCEDGRAQQRQRTALHRHRHHGQGPDASRSTARPGKTWRCSWTARRSRCSATPRTASATP